jgi:hypothetical protein
VPLRLLWLACALCWLVPARLLAQASASEFRSNDYAIDLYTGPVLGSPRIVGMAGAYGAIATGIDGSVFNPAGYAERAETELGSWEWELTGGIWLGGLFSRNDFDNDGSKKLEAGDALQLSVGGRIQVGNVGFGLTAIAQNHTLKDETGVSTDVGLITYRAGGAYAFMRGSVVAGAALRGLSLDISDTEATSDEPLITFDGLGAELGALYRPAYQRHRASLVVRTPVSSRPESEGETGADGVRRVRGFVLPKEVHAPWEVDVGFAYQFGARRSNVPFVNPNRRKRELKQELESGTYTPPPTHGGKPYPALSDDPREALQQALDHEREAAKRFVRSQPRQYVLLSGDLLFSGRTDKGQGVQAFLAQERASSGRKVSVGVRMGAESELVENRLKLRGGSYLEPSRFARVHYRPHGTLGSDVRLFDAWQWSIRASATLDVAPRYFDWGLSVGLWH